jgi:putative copper export protein
MTTLAPTVEAIRLFLHVISAAVFVGGQIVMLGLVPAARPYGSEVTGALARAFARLAWPAFAVLVLTGFWNIGALSNTKETNAWTAVLMAKIAVVVVAGVATWLHQRSSTKRGLAVWGSVAGTASVVALFLGILLAG